MTEQSLHEIAAKQIFFQSVATVGDRSDFSLRYEEYLRVIKKHRVLVPAQIHYR